MAKIGQEMSECVWEVESSLPQDLVTEYNSGVERHLVDDVYSGGRTLHTISLSHRVKMPRVDKTTMHDKR